MDYQQKIEQAVSDAGFIVNSVSRRKNRLYLRYRRASGPTVWEEVSPAFVGPRGRLDYTRCCAAAEEAERKDKIKMKNAIRRLPECRNLAKIIAVYEDHHAKLQPAADGVAFNV